MRLLIFEVKLHRSFLEKIKRIQNRFWWSWVGRWVLARQRRLEYEEFLLRDWPPTTAHDRYGYATGAKPKYGIEQDPTLIEEVGKILALPVLDTSADRTNNDGFGGVLLPVVTPKKKR